MSELKIGDIVQLKSGGPAMTIDNIDKMVIAAIGNEVLSSKPDYAWVSWMDKKDQRQNDSFPVTSLTIYEPRKRAKSVKLRRS